MLVHHGGAGGLAAAVEFADLGQLGGVGVARRGDVGQRGVAARARASLSTPMRHRPPKAMMAVINRMTPKPRPRRGPTRRLLKFMVVSDIGYRVTMEQTGVGGWSMCLLPGTSLALGLGV